ncbi:MAG: hypothetical protein VB065_05355 [Eubacteriales bacterium]|nr:hypothetical protein [Christensenellaceae bacterium]MEA5065461.1 hypothetical protein [Eubacteriales bacterium]
MKRKVLAIYLALVAFFAVNPAKVLANAAPLEQDAVPIRGIIDIAFAQDGGNYFAVDGAFVYHIEKGGRVLRRFHKGDESQYKKIALYENRIWVVDSGRQRFDQFTTDGALVQTYDKRIGDLASIISLDAFGDFLIVHGISEGDASCVWVVDTKSGDWHRVDVEGVNCLAVRPDGLLSIVSFQDGGDEDEASFIHSTHSLSALQLLDEREVNAAAPSSIAFGDGKAYYVSDNTLFSGDFTRQEDSVPMEFLARAYLGRTKLRAYQDGVLMWNPAAAQTVYRVPGQRTSSRTVLTYRGETWLNTGAFSDEHPNVSVVFQEVDDMGGDQLKTMMMTGDKSVDIYQIRSNARGAHGLIENQYFVDLLESDVIAEGSAGWFPRFRALCSLNGRMFGYPIAMFGYGLSANPAYNADVGDVAKDITWAAFLDHMNKIAGGAAPIAGNEMEIMFGIADECINVDVSDEQSARATIREAFQALQSMRERGCFSGDGTNAVMRLQHISGDASAADEFTALPSVARGAPVFPVNVTWMVVNPYSENKETALKLIEYLEGRRRLGESYVLMEAEQPLNTGSREPVSGAFADCYEKCVQYANVPWADELHIDFYNLNLEIGNGTKTVDQGADVFLEKLKISRWEENLG